MGSRLGKVVKKELKMMKENVYIEEIRGRKKMRDGVWSKRKGGEVGGRLENGKERIKNLENLGNRLREWSCYDIYGFLKFV